MKCPKCEVENPEGAMVCHSCGCALKTVETAATSQPIRTSALAKTSLILGLIGLCTLFLTIPLTIILPVCRIPGLGLISLCTSALTSLLAIILGIISLVMISRSHGQLKGTGMAITGIAIPIVMLFVMNLLFNATPRTAQRVQCGSNMQSLGKAMNIYASDNNGMFPTPSRWCDLLIEYTDVSKEEFLCPAAHKGPCNYAMNKNIEELSAKAPPDMVLLFESVPGWNQSGGPEILNIENHQGEGCNVLFSNTHVSFERPEDVNKLRWTADQ